MPFLKKLMCEAAVFFMLGASVLGDGLIQRDSVETGRLNPRVGPADPDRYNSIRDAKEWENPYLAIRPDGIEVIAKGIVSGRKTVSAPDLRKTLIELPLSAWPYGRVVAVQDIGIRAPDRSADRAIANNRETLLAILKRLRVRVERWPA